MVTVVVLKSIECSLLNVINNENKFANKSLERGFGLNKIIFVITVTESNCSYKKFVELLKIVAMVFRY